MACDSCVNTIGSSIHKIEGIISVDVNVAEGLLRVDFDECQATIEQVIKAIELHGDAVINTIG